jgi:hypothetical protein
MGQLMPYKTMTKIEGRDDLLPSQLVFACREDIDAAVACMRDRVPNIQQVIVVETEDEPTHRWAFDGVLAVESRQARIDRLVANAQNVAARLKEERRQQGPWFTLKHTGPETVELRELGVTNIKGKQIGVRIRRTPGEFIEDPDGDRRNWRSSDGRKAGPVITLHADWTLDGRISSSGAIFEVEPPEACEAALERGIQQRIDKAQRLHDKAAGITPPKLHQRLTELADRLDKGEYVTLAQDVALIRKAAMALSGGAINLKKEKKHV